MLQKPKRLTTAIFKEVVLGGKHMHSPIFVMRVKNTQGMSRFSVSVPSKIAKTAVLRNKVRRRIYSALSSLYPSIKEGFHGVIIAKQPILTASFEKITSETKEFFGKSGFLK